MKAIVLYGSFEFAPYAKKYMEILEETGEEYDLIGWRREEIPQYTGDNVYMYGGTAAKRYSSPIRKVTPAFGFRQYAKDIIKKKNYDGLIILTTQTALMLSDVLLGRYRHKYIFDYRDKSYEYIAPYRALVNALIKASVETAISSPWFAEGLTDKKDYIRVHNFRNENLKYKRDTVIKKSPDERISVGYVGALRAYDYHKRLIDMFANDSRFELHTYGGGDDTERLAEYAAKFDNSYVHGVYKEEDKYGIIEQFDLMIYNYPSNFVNDAAVANKYYDALITKKPMLVNQNTKIGRFIQDNRMGVGIEREDGVSGITDKIYEWYRGFDTDIFVKECDKCLDEYIKDNELFEDRIKAAVK